MFDDILREIQLLKNGVRISVNVPLDEKGYFDRKCHAPSCGASFKVFFEDWRQRVKDEIVFCPVCRYEAPSTEWNNKQQEEHLKNVAIDYVQTNIQKALSKDALSFNQLNKGGFVTMSMSIQPGDRPIIVPIDAAKVMEQTFVCESCGCRYSAIGAAFFCPACGFNSAFFTFSMSVETSMKTISTIEAIKIAVLKSYGPDIAENSVRQITEATFCKLVSSFERFAEASFACLPNAGGFSFRKNLFQNLGESSNLWLQANGKGYDSFLNPKELEELNRLFQQRHLLTHKEGVVDQEYMIKTNDNIYHLGQKLIIRDSSVRRLADLILKLSDGLTKSMNKSME